MRGLIPREHLDLATDEELEAYIAYLESEVDAEDLDSGEWTLQPRQQDAEDALADLDPRMSHELLFGGMGGGGKMLTLDTPIPTPSGWTPMGDLRDGDELFASDGSVCRVVQAHEVDDAPVSFEVEFDDGSVVTACADHRWLTFDAVELVALTNRTPEWQERRRAKRPSRATGRRTERFSTSLAARNATRAAESVHLSLPEGTVRTTKEIANTLLTHRGRTNHAVPVTGALNLPHADLPLDPYLLGCWLGDGTAAAGAITSMDMEIVQAFVDDGFTRGFTHLKRNNRASTFGFLGLQTRLRAAGVLKNKHVPDAYLRASAAQRLALLQGLMDTDGTVCDSGAVEFTNTNRALADAVRELAVSLGWKARLVESRATLYGKDCGPKWDVKWTPSERVFRLARKRDKQKLATRRTTRFRYIVRCDEIEPTPMRCITIDHPSGLFLAGEAMIPTHNSDWLLWHCYHACLRYPGLQILMLRRTYKMLRRSLVLRSLERFDRDVCRYLSTETTWKFNNGSAIELGYCESDLDVYQYDSAEYQIIAWDELTQMPTAFPYLYLFSRLRAKASIRARGFVPHVIAATNPGRIGAAWVKARFVDPAPADTRTVHELVDDDGNAIALDADDQPMYGTRIFLPSRLDQNKYISRSQYMASLANLPQAQREAIMLGSWDVIEGQYFSEWDRALHVIDPFEIPAWWTRIRAVDYGHAAPFGCVWIAFDGDGDGYVYRELYERQLTPRQQVALILDSQVAGEHIGYTMIDPSTFTKTGAGIPIAQQYVDAGIPVRRAMNARVDGWARVREYLRPVETPSTIPGEEPTVRVGLKVFSTCTNFIRTFPMLVHDQKNPEDLDSDGDDHLADALRYLLMSRPQRSRAPRKEPVTIEERMAESRRLRDLERRGLKGIDHPMLGRI